MWLWISAVLFVAAAWTLVLLLGLPWWIAAALTGVAVLLVALYYGIRAFQAKRASSEIERSMVAQSDAAASSARPDHRAEMAAIQADFAKAVRALKSSRLTKSKEGALYALPWYLIVGPPGAGKSTALRNSGLRFPSERGAIKGIGGTRNCDWWLSNEAVLLDTAGRYAVQDEDRAEWRDFLALLRRTRTKRPINGLLVAVPADTLLTDAEALDDMAQRLRERIDEIAEELQVGVPVYVMVTKADMVPGFRETFGRLSKSERDQVFGFALPLARSEDVSIREMLGYHLERLAQNNERRAVAELGRERSAQLREGIYSFPQHFEQLVGPLQHTLENLFAPNVYSGQPLLRGVYFTSGTQEGNPIDRMLSNLASELGVPTPVSEDKPDEAKSYFLGDVFRKVVFPDMHLAAPTDARRRRWTYARLGVAAALVAISGLGLFAASVSFARNSALLDEVKASVGAVADVGAKGETGDSGREAAVALLPVRSLHARLQSWSAEGHPWNMGLGLYRGDELVQPMAEYYATTIRRVLVAPGLDILHERMKSILQRHGGFGSVPTTEAHASMYDSLRAYLLLTGRDPGMPEIAGDERTWLSEQLTEIHAHRGDRVMDPESRKALSGHIAAYLELMAQDDGLLFGRDEHLVNQGRELLDRIPQIRLAIDRLVAAIDPLGWDIDMTDVSGGGVTALTASGRVRGAFTKRGWKESIKPLFDDGAKALLGDAWVTGAPQAGSDGDGLRVCALQEEYLERYIDEWKRFIGSVRVEEPSDTDKALAELQDLTRGQPTALQRLFLTVAENAALAPKPSLAEKLQAEGEDDEEGPLDGLKSKLAKGAGDKLAEHVDPCKKTDTLQPKEVAQALRGFYSFGAADGEQNTAQLTSVQVYQEQLLFLRDALQTYMEDPTSIDGLMTRLKTARTRVRGLIEQQAVGWRPRFDALLWPPVNGASIASTSAVAGSKGSQWCTSVVAPYAKSIRGRYPFARTGQDASMEAVAEFYRYPSGTLWAFYESVLANDIQRIGNQFQRRGERGVSAVYNDGVLQFLGASAELSEALFPNNSETIAAGLAVRVRPSPGIASVLLTIDGQEVDFHNGPEKWVRISWPGSSDGPKGASMRVRGANVDETVLQRGPWGLLRLLDKAEISARAGQRFFTARWRLRTQNDVVIDIRPARDDSPFVGNGRFLGYLRASQLRAPAVISEGGKACPAL